MSKIYEEEIFRDIPDFEDYQISKEGIVINKTTGKQLKNNTSGSHNEVRLYKNKKCHSFAIKKLLKNIFQELSESKKNVKKNIENKYSDLLFYDIPNFENYQISEDGIIYNKRTCKEMNISKVKGYLRINLCKNGKYSGFYIHRLLAIMFIDNPKNYDVVDHIDCNPLNNNLKNLRWCSQQNNVCNKKGDFGVNHRIRRENGKIYNTWRARIQYNKEGICKSFPFTDEGYEQARAWRRRKELELFGDFAHHD